MTIFLPLPYGRGSVGCSMLDARGYKTQDGMGNLEFR
ncbi:unnamed protein product, partial [marine sediment metagenome]